VKGYLFGGFEVDIDPRSIEIGGSWQGKARGSKPVAYDAPLVRFFYLQMLEYRAPVILDIGASTGSFCLLSAFHTGATGMAFEPNPAAFKILRANVTLNGLGDRVRLWSCALSDVNGKAMLKLPVDVREMGHATLGKPKTYQAGESIEVATCRLDECLDRVDLMKIDVEGMEVAVLRGGERLIRKHHPGIILEVNARAAAQTAHGACDPIELLWSWGYRNFHGVGVEDVWATV